jgi:hypothetical protein
MEITKKLMYYVCIEDDRVANVLDYAPEVPVTVSVVEIGDAEYQLLTDRSHYFDIPSQSVLPYNTEVIDARAQQQQNKVYQQMLTDSDWQVLRHIRQKALGVPTSLSEAEYLDLELRRNQAAKSIIH